MRWSDQTRYCVQSLLRTGFRSLMLLLSMSIGVASVVLLTSLGESARQFVLGEFASLGTDVLMVLPGRKETTGGLPPLTGGSTRDITLEDSAAIAHLPGIHKVAPVVLGSAFVSHDGISRESLVLGTTRSYFSIRNLSLQSGAIFPDHDTIGNIAVIGKKIAEDLYRGGGVLGRWIRIGNSRFRIVGTLSDAGGLFGTDVSSLVIIPVRGAMTLFNRNGLFRVVAQVDSDSDIEVMRLRIEELMAERHHGERDITVISTDAMLQSFDDVMVIMTLALVAIGGISLVVAGVLIMNVMLISISQRYREIGLLMSLGASSRRIRLLFLTEALLVALGGAILGVALGYLVLLAAHHWYPDFGFSLPVWSILSATTIAFGVSLVFSWLPAGRAARLQPVAVLGHK